VRRFAADNVIPLVHFEKNDRKIDVMRPNLAVQAATGRSGVAAIGVAQEFARVFLATKHTGQTTGVWFSFTKGERRVTCYYFYVWDDDFGPTFVEVCAYFPDPVKIWINGHEWAKRRAAKAGIGFVELSNGFALATDPAGLQAICDRFGPATIGVFAERWCRGCRCRSPTPTAPQVMGGSCRCGRWRSRGPWYSTTRRAGPAVSSRHWSPPASTSVARRRSS
jgi:hypothetical protein